MFFYTIIFIACLTAAFVIPLIYRLITSASTVVQQTIIPKSEDVFSKRSRTIAVGDGRLAAAWDMRQPDVPAQATGQNPNTVWNRHEVRSDFVGKTYKVSRQGNARRANPGVISKPASWA